MLATAAHSAQAICNLIPAAVEELRSTSGTVDRPVGRPGSTVTVRADLACEPTNPAFALTPAGNRVFLEFLAQNGGAVRSFEVPTSAIRVDNCSPVRCDTLRFDIPDTDADLAPAGDGLGRTGPARIRVQRSNGTPVALIGPLFQPTTSCDDRTAETIFQHFTVLPPPNDFAQLASGQTTRILSTIDGGGNLLIPFDFRSVLPAGSGSPVARLVQGVGRLVAFTSDPTTLISIPSPFFVRAFSPIGRPVPPILQVADDGQVIFGSVDADESVLRIARRDPQVTGAPFIYDLSDRLVNGGGPVIIDDFTLITREAAPLQSLKPSGEVLGLARDEGVEGNLNDDTDSRDDVVQVVEVKTGKGTPTRQALFELSQGFRRKPGMTAGGQFVAFLESESHQGEQALNGDRDSTDQIFRAFTSTGADLTKAGAGGPGLPLDVSIDPDLVVDGRSVAVSDPFVVFRTRESDDAMKQTERVSGEPLLPTNAAIYPIPTDDGSKVAFITYAGLVPEDRNGLLDVYVRDRSTRVLQFVSLGSFGSELLLGALGPPATSADGRFVSWTSVTRTNVPGAKAKTQVFLRDLQTGAVELTSHATSPTATSNGDAGSPSLSRDGRFVAFDSVATNLVAAADTNAVSDVFLLDRTTQEMHRLSENAGGSVGAGASSHARISADARFVAFQSSAANLVDGDLNGKSDIFVYDRVDDHLEIASLGNGGIPLDGNSILPSLSDDGRFVAFVSDARNVSPDGTPGLKHVYVYDRSTQTLERMSQNAFGDPANGNAGLQLPPSLSNDGRRVAFVSAASNLVRSDTNGVSDCFVTDRLGKAPERANVGPNDVQANAATNYGCSMSGDGRVVGFDSLASNLVVTDTNGKSDVFVRVATTIDDLNGDDDAKDTVLQVFDTTTRTLQPGARMAASAASVSDGRVALLIPEAEQGNIDFSGDGEKDDAVVVIYDANTQALMPTNVPGDQISLRGPLLCFSSPDQTGATNDSFLFSYRIGEPAPVEQGCAANAVASTGDGCVFLSPSNCGGPSLASFGSSAVKQGGIPYLFTPGSGAVTPLAERAEDFVVGDHLIALRTCEASVGPQVLNDDGDTTDCVMQVYDLQSGQLMETGYATRICDLPGCDPFFEPYRVQGNTVSFLVYESDQGGPTTGPGKGIGCLPSSPVGGCDLSGNGLADDVVIVLFDVRNQSAQTFQIDPEQVAPISPFPDTQIERTVLTVQLTEVQIGADVNGDGILDDTPRVFLVGDSDEDGVFDYSQSGSDTCREKVNPEQTDLDGDGLGDGLASQSCDVNAQSVLPGSHPCDVNNDQAIDRTDIDVIFRDRGMVARASDARDFDVDGLVTALDAAACADRCSLPDCQPAPSCGLLGPELLPLVALAALRRRRGVRRAGRRLAALLLAIGLAGSFAASAQAASLFFEPAESQVSTNEEVALDLMVTGLDATPGAPLRSFDLTFSFEDVLLEFIEAFYGEGLGINEASELFQETSVGDGSVSLAAVSLLSATNLAERQSDSVRLATLVFRSRSEIGTATLSLSQALLGGVSGQSLAAEGAGAVIEVIPEPGTALLVGLGLALVAGRRRSKR